MPDIVLPSVPNAADAGPDTEFDAALSFVAPEPPAEDSTSSEPQDATPADPTPDADPAPADSATEPEPINTRPATSGNTRPHGDPANALASSTPQQRRDYTKFPPELMPFVKRMRNDEFAQAEKILPALYAKAQERDQIAAERDRLQTEASTRPSFVHEHPNGYVLDEQYQAAEQDVARGQYELEFYQEQLARVEAGQEWQHALGWQNGQLQTRTIPAAANGQADPQARALLNQRILNATMFTREKATTRDQFVANYSQQAQAVKGELAEVEAKIFHKLVPEKFTPEEKKLCDMAVNAFPRAFRNSPVVKYLGWAAVGTMRTNKAYADLAAKYKALLTKGAATTRANPRPSPGSVMPGRDTAEVVYDLKKLAEEENY